MWDKGIRKFENKSNFHAFQSKPENPWWNFQLVRICSVVQLFFMQLSWAAVLPSNVSQRISRVFFPGGGGVLKFRLGEYFGFSGKFFVSSPPPIWLRPWQGPKGTKKYWVPSHQKIREKTLISINLFGLWIYFYYNVYYNLLHVYYKCHHVTEERGVLLSLK